MTACHLRAVYAALEVAIPQVQSVEDAVTSGLVLAAVAPSEAHAALVVDMTADIAECLTPAQAQACIERAALILGQPSPQGAH